MQVLSAELISARWTEEAEQLAKAEPDDVKGIAASQLRLLGSFYETALLQARRNFKWALVAATVGVFFFMAAIGFVLASGTRDAATVSAIGGGVVEVIAGVNFVLYGKTTTQLLGLHERLEQTQRFLLANSMCEAIHNEDKKNSTRAALIAAIASPASQPQ